MKNISTLIALAALAVGALAQPALPAQPAQPEADPIVMQKGFGGNAMSLEEFLEIYSQLIDKTIIPAQNLPKVTFTFRTRHDFTFREAREFCETMLSSRGIAIVATNRKFVQAIAATEVGKTPPPLLKINNMDELPEGEIYINYAHDLKHVKATDVVDLLTTFAKSPNAVTAIEGTPTLVLRDFASNVRSMLEIVEKIDVEEKLDQEVAVVKVMYALSADIAGVLAAYTANPTSTSTANTRPGSTSSNRPGSTSSRTGGTSSRTGGTSSRTGGSSSSSSQRGQLQQRLSQVVRGAAFTGTGSAILGDTTITSWERGNEVIIVGTPAKVQQAKELIAKLDRVQPQVLIEAIIMDVALGDDLTFGTSIRQEQQGIVGGGRSKLSSALASASGPAAFATNSVSGLTSGFNWWGTVGLRWQVAVEAAQTDSRVNILSRPRIQTTHASLAELFIGDTRPVVTGSIRDINGGTSSQYQMQKIGITLEVLPFINDEGVVSMDIVQQIQDIVGSQTIDGNAVPITTDRSANAKVNVRDGEMVVLGGFIKTKTTASTSSVPLLGDLPLLGPMFRRNVDVNERNELIVMMRPTVLHTPEAAHVKALSETANMPGLDGALFDEKYLQNKYRIQLDEVRKKKEKIMRQRNGVDLSEPEVEPSPKDGLDLLNRQRQQLQR